VHARLTAEGYPATLLDAYLPGGAPGARDSIPGDDVLNAMRSLGVSDSADIEGLRGAIGLSRRSAGTRRALDANYLGPGDQLVLILTGDVEMSRTLDVTREGFVLILQVGQIPVANLTLAALESVLYTRLGRAYSGVKREGGTTRFSVTVSKLRMNQVFVNGDVDRPGSYRISGAGTALTALYAAGGPSDIGSMRRVGVRRSGKVKAVSCQRAVAFKTA
jgi:protein involved in polysaccharide export with SLBB domain